MTILTDTSADVHEWASEQPINDWINQIINSSLYVKRELFYQSDKSSMNIES